MNFSITVGSYGGFYFARQKQTGSLRLCLGWIAFTLYLYDVEASIEKILLENKKVGQVTRFEVIDQTGRVYSKWNIKSELSYQDDGQTLKVFITPRSDKW